jgi:glycerophosphoryl diester phosphodiesterase
MKNTLTLPPVIAHRGASACAPENTFASIIEAAKQGATWIEIDVTVTQDNIPVILHDHHLERTTSGEGRLLQQNYNDIKDLDAGSWFDSEFSSERIPTLKDTLALCQKLNLGANLEIKPIAGWQRETSMAIIAVINEGPSIPLLISSFDTHCLHLFKSFAPLVPRALNTDIIPTDWHACLKSIDACRMHFYLPYFDPIKIAAIKAAGYQVACFTVNCHLTAQELFNGGVDNVFSDHPKVMLEALKSMASDE